MKSKSKFVKKPCANCPFRKDTLKGWLGEKKITEILNDDAFVCHETLKGGIANRKQCAGFMILKKEESAFVRVAASLDIDLNLKGQELVFDNQQDCIDHHKN